MAHRCIGIFSFLFFVLALNLYIMIQLRMSMGVPLMRCRNLLFMASAGTLNTTPTVFGWRVVIYINKPTIFHE